MIALPRGRVLGLVVARASDDPAGTVRVGWAAPDQPAMYDELADELRISVTFGDPDSGLGEGIAKVHDNRDETLRTKLANHPLARLGTVGPRARGTRSLAL